MIQPTTTAAQSLAAAATTKPPEKAETNSDYDTFLRMLTTQMTNQDPLNPIDSSDYAAQLANFSSVEQQVVTNDLLSDMIGLLSAGGLSDMASWVGRDVRSDAPGYFDGTPVSLGVTTLAHADSSVLEVRNSAGQLVQSLPINATDTSIEWAGVDNGGSPFATGEYTFKVENLVKGESVGTTQVATYNEVVEARLDGGKLSLLLLGGRIVTADSVSGLRS